MSLLDRKRARQLCAELQHVPMMGHERELHRQGCGDKAAALAASRICDAFKVKVEESP